MTRKFAPFAAACCGLAGILLAQSDILEKIVGGQTPVIAVPDLKGTGAAQEHMGVFNQTLYDEIAGSGLLKVAPKGMYPLEIPQTEKDFRAPVIAPPQPGRKSKAGPVTIRQGPWLTDWSQPPVSAHYLAFGYTAVQNDRLVLYGFFYDVTQPDLTNARVFGKLYFGAVDANGARQVAREFAADILARFGVKSLAGSKIYFVSNRTGNKEIWSMDYDGANQTQVTAFKSITTMPSISADNSKLAFTTFARGNPNITVFSTESNRRLTFTTPQASVNQNLDFTPDGNQVIFASSVGGGFANLYSANSDGSGLRRLTSYRAVEVEPKVNPKTGTDVVFTSGRSGPPQVYRMNMDGADIERLTSGEGDAVNPSWHPQGQLIAFAWTRGFEPGNFNIFVMDVARKQYIQLTHGAGRNENPVWAPDGRHLVFASNRNGKSQIYTMLADGTGLKRLTSAGENEKPVWSK